MPQEQPNKSAFDIFPRDQVEHYKMELARLQSKNEHLAGEVEYLRQALAAALSKNSAACRAATVCPIFFAGLAGAADDCVTGAGAAARAGFRGRVFYVKLVTPNRAAALTITQPLPFAKNVRLEYHSIKVLPPNYGANTAQNGGWPHNWQIIAGGDIPQTTRIRIS